MDRISNREAQEYVKEKVPFLANNLSADWSGDGEYYMVFSYDKYPIYIYISTTDNWYETDEKYSITTAKHMSQTRPDVTTVIQHSTMEDIMSRGIVAVVSKRVTQ